MCRYRRLILATLLAVAGGSASAAASPSAALRASWRQPQAPERIYGNTWYVGSRGLSAILITSPQGHVLIDATLPENAPMIEANIRQLGSLAIRPHPTPGHTPGSTSWTWTSCEGTPCRAMVYADSLTLLAAGSYRYTDPAHPKRLDDFRRALAMLAALPCDILMTPHPEASDLLERLAARDAGHRDALRDPHACKAYARLGEQSMRQRVREESAPSR
ncbi:hypothetical protein ACO2Q2_02600 [Dyella sp. KRB-257]|uniref:hypothetical protein n=1 Tax=Dyella sp. KRB-257 TaxID=3400915 RepID=UPI003BFD19AE